MTEMPSLEKITAAAEKLNKSVGKPKRKRRKAKKSVTPKRKRSLAAKKAARTRKLNHQKRSRAAKKAAKTRRRGKRRLPKLDVLRKRHKSLVDRKSELDRRYAIGGKMPRKQYLRSLGALVRKIKLVEAQLSGGKFEY